jgi:4-hydroxybenzoate polyprenyltransferase
MIFALVKACRLHQWIKNLFVAAPLVFARRIDDAHAVTRCLVAVLCFCLLSSAVYLLNDIVDRDKDRAHPRKRFRPIASGALPVTVARAAALLFATSALLMASALDQAFAGVAVAYLSLNLAYSFGLKRIPFVDVACIALGFLLRVLGGAIAIPVPASGWLLVCTLLLASLLGFGKRAHELRMAGAQGKTQRTVLDHYRPQVLRFLLAALAGLTVITYASYTQSAHALEFFGTRLLALTIPSVGFGIHRFLAIVNGSGFDSPTDSMLRDGPFLVNLTLYAGAIVAIIYGYGLG